MKIIRIGNTELNLTFMYYVEFYHENLTNNEIKKINEIKSRYIDWIYKTAGYYDKNVKIENTYNLRHYTENLKNYIGGLLESYRNSDILYNPFIRVLYEYIELHKYIKPFLKYLNCNMIEAGCIYYLKNIKSFILNKKVLLITPFSDLIKQQIENNNFNVLYNNIYKNTEFVYYTFPYKFFNTGEQNNNFETLEIIKNEINKLDFDVALLSCGADAGYLSDYIHGLNKCSIYIGGNLPVFFGIFGKREKQNSKNKFLFENENINDFSPYIITEIPDKYKPPKFNDIENGCYW
jgi:hypothetical protein